MDEGLGSTQAVERLLEARGDAQPWGHPVQSPRGGTHLSETPLTACSSTFFLSTSLICPFSGPFFTFSLPIR